MKEITDFIVSQGISEQGFFLLLSLPLVASVIGFGRHIIGLRTIGIYMPISLTYAFYLFGTTDSLNSWSNLLLGIRIGLIFVLGVYVATTIGHILTHKIRLHYLPKISIVITIVTTFMLAIIVGATDLGLIKLANLNPIAVILLVIASEQFLGVFIKKNLSSATIYGFETLLLALIGFCLISIVPLQNLLLTYPLIILIAIPVNLAIGKFVGLRLNEYFRFSDILNQDEPDNDSKE